MKKGLTILTALVILITSLPMSAMAAGGLISSEDLTAAVLLTGQDEDASGFHAGMTIDETLSARQLIFWLEDVLENEVHSLENHYEDMENKLYSVSQEDPAKYQKLTTGRYEKLPELTHDQFRDLIDLRLRLERWLSRLNGAASDIMMGKEQLTAQDVPLSEHDARRLSYEIREGAKEIRAVRSEMAAEAGSMLKKLQEMEDALQGGSYAVGAGGETAEPEMQLIDSWNDQLLGDAYQKTVSLTASAADLFPQQQTLLGRLSPISSASAADGNTAILTILDDHQFAVTVHDRNGNGIEGAHVEVMDTRAEKNPKTDSGDTRESGSVIFGTDGYDLWDDMLMVSLEVTKEGYQDIIIRDADIKKGSNILLNMQPPAVNAGTNEKEPYISQVSFDSHDCLFSEYEAIANPENTRENDILVTLNNVSNHKVAVILVYRDRDGKQYYRTMKDKDSKTFIEAGQKADLKIKAAWRRRLKAGGDDLLLEKNGEKVSQGKGTVLLLIQKDGTNVSESDTFKEGIPKWTEGTVVVKTSLKTEAAKLPGPIINKYLNAAFFSSSSLFSLDIPLNTKSDAEWLKNLNLSMDLPFEKYKPKIYGATNGFMVVSLGVSLPSVFEEGLETWESQDVKSLKNMTDYSSKKSGFKKFLSANKDLWKLAKVKGGVGLRKVKADVFPFAALQFRWNYNAKNGHWEGVDLAGTLGISGTLDVSFTGQYMVGGVFPVTAGLNFNATLTLAANLGGTLALRDGEDLTEANMLKTGVDPRIAGGSLGLKLMVTAFGGVGVKGFVSLTLNFYAYINFLFEITGDYLHASITWGLGFFALLEAVVVKAKLSIWDMPTKPLLDQYWYWYGDEKSSLRMPSFSDLFISRARAEESSGGETELLQAEDYPDLVPDSEQILGPVPMAGSRMQVVEIGGEPYVFYVAQGAGSNGKNRITWRRISTGQTGTFDQILKDAANGRKRYTVKSGSTLDTGGWIDRYFENEESLAALKGFYAQNDLDFQVVSVLCEDENLLSSTYGEIYMLAALCGNVEMTDDALKALDEPAAYTLAFMRQADGSLTCDIPTIQTHNENTEVQTDDTFVIRPLMNAGLRKASKLPNDKLAASGVTAVSRLQFGRPYDSGSGKNIRTLNLDTYVLIGDVDILVYFSFPTFHTSGSSRDFLPKMYGPRTEGTGVSGENAKRSGLWQHAYYSLQNRQEDGKVTLRREIVSSSSLCVNIAEGKDIAYYEVMPTAEKDILFWLEKEESPETGEKYHLHAGSLNHHFLDSKDLFTDLDVTVTGLSFDIQQVGRTVYVYWIENTTDPENQEETVCRLRGVAYDPYAGVASDDFVLAQFKMPSGMNMKELLLTEDGKGYYVLTDNLAEAGTERKTSMEGTVFSFPFRLIASLDLVSIHLSQDVISIGENDTVLVKLVNNGNVAISSFDILESVIGKDGTVSDVQTVHCDTVHPENNVLHMVGDKEKNDIRGDHAAWRTTTVWDDVVQSYWQITQLVREWQPHGSTWYGHVDTTQEVELTASEILPGQVAVFTLMMKVPSSWRNEQRLKFELNQYAATVNYMRSAALKAGLAAPSLQANAEEELVYVRDADGRMRLKNPVLLSSGVNNGSISLFAAEVNAPAPASMNHELHNISVKNRVYPDLNGERRVSIFVTDDAAHMEEIKWYCNVYLDGNETPYAMNLPYEADSTSHARTHTIDLPVSALLGGKTARRIKVEVRGVGIEEMTLADNFFYIDLEVDDPLRIVLQPENVDAEPGQTVEFHVAAAGGQPPYSFQWQVSDGNGGWKDIEGATSDTLTLENVTDEMNNTQYRCVVTDFNNTSVTSGAAVLTVCRKIPQTGDAAVPILWMICTLFGMAGLCLFVRRKKMP